MEASSLFEDLVYSLEISGHKVNLRHYGTRMLLDTGTLQREYREWFVPEEWPEPYIARAEISFELDPLAEARMQYTPEEIADAFGLLIPDDYDVTVPALQVELEVRFALDLENWVSEQEDTDRWLTYLATISARDRLEAGLRNLRGEVRRALQTKAHDAAWDPPLEGDVETVLIPGHGLLVKTINVVWMTTVHTELDEDEFTTQLDGLLALVRTGIEAVRAFQDEIQADYRSTP